MTLMAGFVDAVKARRVLMTTVCSLLPCVSLLTDFGELMRLFSGLRVLNLTIFLASRALLFMSVVGSVPPVGSDVKLYTSVGNAVKRQLSFAFCVPAGKVRIW
ncbi:hypothetical protein E2C01_039842 [Portunus trituberculatus]|uniref:Uncharacterized protein n=1 Tax=Portunus trituberculatus TaxID=210409 RepID=A0A5B7FM00_PORTR|nr:hypothetical protein [Portunus trituberculatus]